MSIVAKNVLLTSDPLMRLEHALAPYGFVNLTSRDDVFPSLSMLGDGHDHFELRVQIGTSDGGAGEIFIHTHFEECPAVYGYSRNMDVIIDKTHDIDSAIISVQRVHNAMVIYSYLVGNGYKVESTGGGCTAWVKDGVIVTNDSDANLIDEHECGHFETAPMVWMAIDNTDHEMCMPTSDTHGFIQALKNLEAINKEIREPKRDEMELLSVAYGAVLKKHFSEFGTEWSADDLLIAHGDEMTPRQQHILHTFIKFWEALEWYYNHPRK